jgi:hypothetical protein
MVAPLKNIQILGNTKEHDLTVKTGNLSSEIIWE